MRIKSLSVCRNLYCYASAPVFREGRRDFDKQIALHRQM